MGIPPGLDTVYGPIVSASDFAEELLRLPSRLVGGDRTIEADHAPLARRLSPAVAAPVRRTFRPHEPRQGAPTQRRVPHGGHFGQRPNAAAEP